MKNNICPICGFLSVEPFFKHNSNEPNWGHNWCDCCSFEFGIDEIDSDEKSYTQYRGKWISLHHCVNTIKKWSIDDCLLQLENLQLVDIREYPLWVQSLNTDWTAEVNANLVRKEFMPHNSIKKSL